MAEVHGKGGSFAFTNLTAGVKGWTITYEADMHETTDFADAGVAAFIAGIKRWSGTCELNWDSANTVAPGDSAAATFDVDGTNDYQGTALVQSLSVNTGVNDIVSATCNFQGTGALTPPS